MAAAPQTHSSFSSLSSWEYDPATAPLPAPTQDIYEFVVADYVSGTYRLVTCGDPKA
jgi:hypothetical protein